MDRGRMTALLELDSILKSFPGVKALEDVHFAAGVLGRRDSLSSSWARLVTVPWSRLRVGCPATFPDRSNTSDL